MIRFDAFAPPAPKPLDLSKLGAYGPIAARYPGTKVRVTARCVDLIGPPRDPSGLAWDLTSARLPVFADLVRATHPPGEYVVPVPASEAA